VIKASKRGLKRGGDSTPVTREKRCGSEEEKYGFGFTFGSSYIRGMEGEKEPLVHILFSGLSLVRLSKADKNVIFLSSPFSTVKLLRVCGHSLNFWRVFLFLCKAVVLVVVVVVVAVVVII